MFLASVPLPLAMVGRNLSVIRANEDMAVALGFDPAELAGRSIGEAMPGLAGMVAPAVEEAMSTKQPVTRVQIVEERIDGEQRNWQLSTFPVMRPDGKLLGAGLLLVDVTRDQRTARDLVDRARRLAAVASLGQRALSGRPLHSLMDDAVRLVSTTLRIEVVHVFERLPDDVLLLRAATGVPEEQVGVAALHAGRQSQAGYAMMTRSSVVAEDLANDHRFGLTPYASGLGVRSGVTVVIRGADGDLWGVLAAHSVNLRTFSADDIHFLELVANVLGVAIQRQRAEDQVRDSHARLDLSLRAGGLVSWDWELGTGSIQWHGELPGTGADAPTASTVEEFLGWVHPEDREQVGRDIEQMGAVSGEYHSVFRLQRNSEEPRWLEARGQIVKDELGAPVRVTGVVADITERRLIEEIKGSLLEGEHQARVAAEEARERLSMLAEAGAALARSLEPRSTLLVLHDLLLPRFCDAIVVYGVEDGQLEEVVLDHADPAMASVLEALRQKGLDEGGGELWSARRAVRTGRSELLEHITDTDLVAGAVDAEQLALLRELGPNSAVSLPLVARGRVVGALAMLRCGDRTPFSPEDLLLVEDLAARAAMAVDNARLFESRSAVAQTLQRSLLPPALPEIPGVDVATRYRVAGGDIEIGGDFYDLFEVGGGAWAAVIGDVCGKGTVAAALTGLFRHTVRAAAVREVEPSQILRFTNQIILDQIEDTRFCTAAMLRIEPGHRGLAISVVLWWSPAPAGAAHRRHRREVDLHRHVARRGPRSDAGRRRGPPRSGRVDRALHRRRHRGPARSGAVRRSSAHGRAGRPAGP